MTQWFFFYELCEEMGRHVNRVRHSFHVRKHLMRYLHSSWPTYHSLQHSPTHFQMAPSKWTIKNLFFRKLNSSRARHVHAVDTRNTHIDTFAAGTFFVAFLVFFCYNDGSNGGPFMSFIRLWSGKCSWSEWNALTKWTLTAHQFFCFFFRSG